MMDMPPEMPPASEQVSEQRLVSCGLSKSGFTVSYEEDFQSVVIVITPAAGVRQEHFPCIHEAAEYGIVTFENDAMQIAYSDYESVLHRPEMLQQATAELQKLGLLAGFPDRASFATPALYAEALEVHAGVAPNTALRADGKTIVFDPPRDDLTPAGFADRYANLLAVIMFAVARRDFENFGFVGNEYVEPEAE